MTRLGRLFVATANVNLSIEHIKCISTNDALAIRGLPKRGRKTAKMSKPLFNGIKHATIKKVYMIVVIYFQFKKHSAPGGSAWSIAK